MSEKAAMQSGCTTPRAGDKDAPIMCSDGEDEPSEGGHFPDEGASGKTGKPDEFMQQVSLLCQSICVVVHLQLVDD